MAVNGAKERRFTTVTLSVSLEDAELLSVAKDTASLSIALRGHQDFPDHYRLRFFEGGHDWADAKLIAEGMALVLGEALKVSRNRDLNELKRDYARTMMTWASKLQTDEPWETVLRCSCCSFLRVTK